MNVRFVRGLLTAMPATAAVGLWLTTLAAAALWTMTAAFAQGSLLPIPGGVVAAGDVLLAVDENNIVGASNTEASGLVPLLRSLKIGTPSGTELTQIAIYSEELTPVAVAANLCAEEAFTVTGLSDVDKLVVAMDEPIAAASSPISLVQARPSGADTLALTFCNLSSASASPTSGTYEIVAIRS